MSAYRVPPRPLDERVMLLVLTAVSLALIAVVAYSVWDALTQPSCLEGGFEEGRFVCLRYEGGDTP